MKDYAAAERRHRMSEDAPNTDALAAEQAARYAGLLKIERGAGAFRVTFPTLSDPDDAIRRAAFREARPILDQVKAIMGRKYDALNKAWIVPLDMAQSVECLALDYGATIEDAATDDAAAARIAELERALVAARDERDAALRLADSYAAELERLAEANDPAYQAAAMDGEDTSGWFAEAQARANGKRYTVQTIRSTGRALDEDRTDSLDRARVRADGFGAHFPAQVIDNDSGAVVYATGEAVAA